MKTRNAVPLGQNPAGEIAGTAHGIRRTLGGNILANAFGRIWDNGSQLIFVPIYLHLLGPEAYGLVAFFSTLYITLGFLDAAVSPILIRELGHLHANPEPAAVGEARQLLHVLEMTSFGMGLICAAAVVLLAPLIAHYWIHAGNLPQSEVINTLRLMGLGLACQWPVSFYSGGYMGYYRQDLLTSTRISILAVQRIGGALLLWLVLPSVELLFAWQAITSAMLVFCLRRGLWGLLPLASKRSAPLTRSRFRGLFGFGAGTLLIGLMSSLLLQADNLFVSRFAPLALFTAYSLSFSLALPVSASSQTVSSVLMPLFSSYMLRDDQIGLAEVYHRWTQVLICICVPVAGSLMFFCRPLLMLWLGSKSTITPMMLPLVPWIVAGSLFNAIMTPPFLLQLAAGWTRLSVVTNLLIVPLFLAALVIGIPRFGVIVGAECWLAMNLAYYFLEVPVMHGRILRGEMWAWWIKDTGFPMALTAAVFLASVYLAPEGLPLWASVLQAAITAIIAVVLLMLVLPYPRGLAVKQLRRLRAPPTGMV